MNYNEMSAQQCADWLAEKDGWVKTLAKGADESDGEDGYFWAKGGKWQWEHPMPLTLDAAAGALPAKMFFYVNYCILFGEETYVVCAVTKGTRIKEFRSEGPDELTARYRAAVAARMEEER